MKHVNLTAQGDRSTETKTKWTRRRSKEHHSRTMPNTSQRKAAASPEASKNRCNCPAGASRWYGYEEETITPNITSTKAAIVNNAAEVARISSDLASLASQIAESDSELSAASTFEKKGCRISGSPRLNCCTLSRRPSLRSHFLHEEIDTRNTNSVVAALITRIDAAVSQVQQTAQQFQTTFDAEQSLESETELHWGAQDGQRHCRLQAGKVR